MNKKWEVKETESLKEKSGKAADVLRKLWCTQGQNTHTVWMKSKPEHMVSAEEDTTRTKRKKSIKMTCEEYKNKWSGCVKPHCHAGACWNLIASLGVSIHCACVRHLCDPDQRAKFSDPPFPVSKTGILLIPMSDDCWRMNYIRFSI